MICLNALAENLSCKKFHETKSYFPNLYELFLALQKCSLSFFDFVCFVVLSTYLPHILNLVFPNF